MWTKGSLQFTVSVNEKITTAVLLKAFPISPPPPVRAVEECDEPVLCDH